MIVVKTFDEILTFLCDEFDSYIAPKKIRRTNNSIVYLIMKAIAKGYEVINNVVFSLSKKFDVDYCTDNDLISTAKMVGTDFREGSSSSLEVFCYNSSAISKTLTAGTYIYKQSEEVIFKKVITEDIVINTLSTSTLTFISATVGSFPVTAIGSLNVVREDGGIIDATLKFSCSANDTLLGQAAETPAEFRVRVSTDQTRQDIFRELEEEIKNIPSIFECKLYFNRNLTNDTIPVGESSITIPPFHLLIILQGEVTDEIAELVASKGIYPTVSVVGGGTLYYLSDVLSSGSYPVNYMNFAISNYDLEIKYTFDSSVISYETIEATINAALVAYKNSSIYRQYVTEDIFYTVIKGLNLPSVNFLDVNLIVSGSPVSYIEIPQTTIARLLNVTYTRV